jgi:hypothetical protein
MQYYGVYRGVVADSNDPLGIGRVVVSLPTLGVESWAPVVLPPIGGPSVKFQVGATVIVAFEQGDVARPVVLGRVATPSDATSARK